VFTQEALQAMLDRLQACLDENGDMLRCLHELVPTFREADAVNSEAQKEKSAV